LKGKKGSEKGCHGQKYYGTLEANKQGVIINAGRRRMAMSRRKQA
jgi:hypothetical protein